MQYLTIAALLMAAIIHLLPLAGVLGAEPLQRLYGLPVAEPNLEILLRHRAVLFGLLGSFLLIAAFRPAWHGAALAAGLISVLSFLLLAWRVGGYNAEIGRVVLVDVVALAVLIVGSVAFVWRGYSA